MKREFEITSLQDELAYVLRPYAEKPFPNSEDQILMMKEIISVLQNAVCEANDIPLQSVKVEVLEEDSEMAVIREVLEIPLDAIHMRVTLQQSFPISYIVLQCRLDPDTGELWSTFESPSEDK